MKKRNAFTLAEVLITLGIIGIVAAMTLPALVQQNQKKVAATRLKQAYSQIYQAINMAQADYGDMKNWDVNDNYKSSVDLDKPEVGRSMGARFAEKYMLPYLKHTSNVGLFKVKDLGYDSYNSKDGRVYLTQSWETYVLELANGVTLFIGYNGNSETYTLPIIFVDINGKSKPNVLGRDFFMFELDSINTMKVRPSGYGNTRETLLERCAPNPSSSAGNNLACTALIMTDGWEIKNDYPW